MPSCSDGHQFQVTGKYTVKMHGGPEDGAMYDYPQLDNNPPTPWVKIDDVVYDLVEMHDDDDYYDYVLRKESNE